MNRLAEAAVPEAAVSCEAVPGAWVCANAAVDAQSRIAAAVRRFMPIPPIWKVMSEKHAQHMYVPMYFRGTFASGRMFFF
jgi:hypothetical protein